MQKIVITGGCGFIGSSLSKLLLDTGDAKIRVIDNLSVGSVDQLSARVQQTPDQSGSLDWSNQIEVVNADVTCLDDMRKSTSGATHLVHLAANTGVAPSVDDPLFDCFTNIVGTVNSLECCRLYNISKFVFASSGAPLGEQDPPISESCVPKPRSPYGASKLSGEGYCSAYHGTFGIQTVALRFGNVYGPGSVFKSSAVAKFIKLGLQKQTIEVYGDGKQTRDFVYIDDLCLAIVKALTVNNIGGEIFQIATSSETSVDELIFELSNCFSELNLEFPKVIYGETRLGDVKRNFSDTTKAQTLLDWKSKEELSHGLRKTLSYFMNEGSKVE